MNLTKTGKFSQREKWKKNQRICEKREGTEHLLKNQVNFNFDNSPNIVPNITGKAGSSGLI